MSKIAYFECPTGIAGDMCLAALIDAGVPLDYLLDRLAQLGIAGEYHITTSQVQHHGQTANHVEVELLAIHTTEHGHGHNHSHEAPEHSHKHQHHHEATEHTHSHDQPHHHHHSHQTLDHKALDKEQHYHSPQRNLPVITELIDQANLPPRAAHWSKAIFQQLAIAEGLVHGIAPEFVHFHEVGAVDAIVDIVGTCLALDYLGIEEIYCSPLPTGGGTVKAAHGIMPVPVPAVLQLWQSRQVPIYSNGIDRELVTPTGAAIAVALAKAFGPPPAMALHKIGLGAGTLQLPLPNILRLWIGEAQIAPDSVNLEEIWVLETQVDDLNPQIVGYLFDRILAAGAVDIFSQPVAMKKSRPGILLTVICHPDKIGICEQIIFRETTTLGIRRSRQDRAILPRQIQTVDTPYGPVRVKVATSNHPPQGEIWNIQPEYADCATLADRYQVSWQTIHDAARLALQQQLSA
jgi:pyridinium-3,5-bisthiocarboxylic acid mononucleotide nickel chelatase